MKKIMLAAALLGLALTVGACSRVGNGEVGVRYHTMGSDVGVEKTALGMGWYLTGPGTAIETFPTFTQTVTWTEGNNEQFTFSDSGGLAITADMGLSYHVDPTMAPDLFQKYRRGIDEITNLFVHNMVRDSLVEHASKMPVESIYGPGREPLRRAVQSDLEARLKGLGIVVEQVYWVGNLGLPDSVKASIQAKTNATQIAQMTENQVATAKAQAEKNVAEAEGHAKARLVQAQAEAEANRQIAASISPTLVEYLKVQKWNGQTPRIASGAGSFSMMVQDK